MVPSGTKANSGRPRPHPPLPLAQPTKRTNEGEGDAPGGVTPRRGPAGQTGPGSKMLPPVYPTYLP